jgi:hypothetical protein
MAYVRLDDQIAHHPKVLRAGAEAAWLWACAIAYCNRQLTDGAVPAEALATMGTFRTPVRKLAATLVAVGLFDADGDQFRVHDYLAANPDKATVLERLREAADRKAAYRARKGKPDTTPPGRKRDANVHMGQASPSTQDTAETGASSRASRTSSPPPPINQLPTDTECVSVVAHTIATRPASDWGASPAKKFSPNLAHKARRDGLSVPQFLHAELLSKLATPDERALLAWYVATEAAYDGKAIGETALQFWRARFAEWQGTTGPRKVAGLMGGGRVATAASSVVVIDPNYNGQPYRFHCGHTPTCATWPQCRDAQAEVAS